MRRDVPDDVLLEIFLFLPANSIMRFRFVCKYWFDLITSISIHNQRFVQMHIDHHCHKISHNATIDNLPTILCIPTNQPIHPNHNLYSINNNNASISSSSSSSSKNKKKATEIVYPFKSPNCDLKILGSCNGLLCIQVIEYNSNYDNLLVLCIWNPTTNEFKQVPPRDSIIYHEYLYGFGYDRFINDYKLVSIGSLNFTSDVIEVYTLGTNSWKMVDKQIPYGLLGSNSSRMGFYLNGALHWISKEDSRIYSFNIEDEEFGVMPKPECLDKVMLKGEFQVLRGCLCIFSTCSYQNINGYMEVAYEVWIMLDYGVKESWTKLCRVTTESLLFDLKPIWIYKNGEVGMTNNKGLVIYDPNTDMVIGYEGLPYHWRKTIVHIGSLVSLKSSTYVGQEQQ